MIIYTTHRLFRFIHLRCNPFNACRKVIDLATKVFCDLIVFILTVCKHCPNGKSSTGYNVY